MGSSKHLIFRKFNQINFIAHQDHSLNTPISMIQLIIISQLQEIIEYENKLRHQNEQNGQIYNNISLL